LNSRVAGVWTRGRLAPEACCLVPAVLWFRSVCCRLHRFGRLPQVTAPGAEFIFRTFPARNHRGIAVSPLRSAHKLHTFPFSCSEFCDCGPPYRLTTSQRASLRAAHGLDHWLPLPVDFRLISICASRAFECHLIKLDVADRVQ